MERQRQAGWPMNLLLTAVVMVTVFLALVLAQFDALQARMLPQRSGLPIVNIQATAVAVGQVIPLLGAQPAAPAEAVAPVADDLNPRPEFITGVSEAGLRFAPLLLVEHWLNFVSMCRTQFHAEHLRLLAVRHQCRHIPIGSPHVRDEAEGEGGVFFGSRGHGAKGELRCKNTGGGNCSR